MHGARWNFRGFKRCTCSAPPGCLDNLARCAPAALDAATARLRSAGEREDAARELVPTQRASVWTKDMGRVAPGGNLAAVLAEKAAAATAAPSARGESLETTKIFIYDALRDFGCCSDAAAGFIHVGARSQRNTGLHLTYILYA